MKTTGSSAVGGTACQQRVTIEPSRCWRFASSTIAGRARYESLSPSAANPKSWLNTAGVAPSATLHERGVAGAGRGVVVLAREDVLSRDPVKHLEERPGLGRGRRVDGRARLVDDGVLADERTAEDADASRARTTPIANTADLELTPASDRPPSRRGEHGGTPARIGSLGRRAVEPIRSPGRSASGSAR